MTTLTERLRELKISVKLSACPVDEADEAISFAQELHALLVECGEELARSKKAVFNAHHRLTIMETKLQQAGIV